MCDVYVYRYTNPRKWKILTKIDNERNFLTKYIPTWLYLKKTEILDQSPNLFICVYGHFTPVSINLGDLSQ